MRMILDGATLADIEKPRLVFETDLPTRHYLPADDVRTDPLSPSEIRTLCAYKKEAAYRPATVGDEVYDIAWSYPDPMSDNPQLQGLVCFLNEQAHIEVGGERPERLTTQWSGELLKRLGPGQR
jgi:uncharacterized protein (DUF427 family)